MCNALVVIGTALCCGAQNFDLDVQYFLNDCSIRVYLNIIKNFMLEYITQYHAYSEQKFQKFTKIPAVAQMNMNC